MNSIIVLNWVWWSTNVEMQHRRILSLAHLCWKYWGLEFARLCYGL